ncbi:MAG TPA: DUF6178 family protein [Geobacteraceae bacterium]
MTQHTKSPLTLHKGGRLSFREFSGLPLAEKVQHIQGRPAKERLDLIIADPEGQNIVREFPALDLYLLVKELGETDALELVQFASAEQFTFMLDLELWERWHFLPAKALLWLGYLLEGGEEPVVSFFRQADPEFLTLIFMEEITVGGGMGLLETDDDRLATWDHSFDNIYYITFNHAKHSEIVGRLLDVLYRRLHPLYTGLMESVKAETVAELEELAFQFRSGRLADEGFPELEHALELYMPVSPARYVASGAKESSLVPVSGDFPVQFLTGDSLLRRTLGRCGSAELLTELHYLINNVLVADGADFTAAGAIEGLFQRVYGYLNIALEYLSSGDEEKAEEILSGEPLRELFRLGFSLVVELQRRWGKMKHNDYKLNKVLEGVRAARPRYYRGLDPDGVDAYREFQTFADVTKVAEVLGAA